MSELKKTLIYVGVAIVLAVVALASRPRQPEFVIQEKVGKALFDDFQDPTEAASLEVVRFDESLGELHTFSVAKESGTGRWVIPSHSNYPADAENQMRDAATSLIGLNVLDIASEQEGDHKDFGVVEPDKEKLKVGDEGIGLKVAISNQKGKPLARLIIGGKVKGSEDQRFVRVVGQNPVYVAKIDPQKLSTKFEDWIEKDLLKLNSWDIQQIKLKDYSVVQTNRGAMLDRRFDVSLTYNNDDYKWKLDEMTTYRDNKATPGKLGEAEELNTDRINDLKNALDELKIVDVRRKPKGLGANLKADQSFMKNQENVESLVERGFYIDPNGLDLWAANGDMQVAMKDGVEYVLRFGNIAGADAGGDQSKLNRYLFVSAKLDQSRIPPPQLEKVPLGGSEEKSAAAAPDAKEAAAGGEKPDNAKPPADETGKAPAADQKKADEKKAEDKKAAEKKPDDTNTQEKKADEKAESQENQLMSDAGAPQEEKAKAADRTDKSGPTSPTGPTGPTGLTGPTDQPSKAATEKKDEAKKDDAKKDEAKKDDAEPDSDQERERIRKENKKKQDEYDEKIKEAEKKVRELNDRFSDWYYVISEDVYKKIHLGRADIVKESEKAKEVGEGVDSFRDLEKGGPEGKKPEAKKDEEKNP